MTVVFSIMQRAVFGDVKGAHNVVAASNGAPQQVISDLASRYTDRLLPTEIAWEPYLCGFTVGGFYVLTRTFAVAATRPGMVQTHALIIQAEYCAAVAG